jgi:hypothetical protein
MMEFIACAVFSVSFVSANILSVQMYVSYTAQCMYANTVTCYCYLMRVSSVRVYTYIHGAVAVLLSPTVSIRIVLHACKHASCRHATVVYACKVYTCTVCACKIYDMKQCTFEFTR